MVCNLHMLYHHSCSTEQCCNIDGCSFWPRTLTVFNREVLPSKSFPSLPFFHIPYSKVRSKIKLYQRCPVFSFLEEIFVLSSDSSAEIFCPMAIERKVLHFNKQQASERPLALLTQSVDILFVMGYISPVFSVPRPKIWLFLSHMKRLLITFF